MKNAGKTSGRKSELEYRTSFFVGFLINKERIIPHVFQRLCFRLIKSANLIIVDNQKLKDDLQKYHRLVSVQVEVIAPGVDIESIRKIIKAPKIYDAIFIGQLRLSKGIFDIPKIWEEVIKKIPQANLAIIGKNIGENQSLLEKQISDKHLTNNISVLGFRSTEETFSLLKSAKCFILPSYEEGFGMVVLESLICKTPVIAYDLPVFQEYFPGCVTVSPIGNTTSFSSKVIAKIKLNQKEDYPEIYKKFDIKQLVKREYNLIHHIYEK
jgi:glycosyltransferase involved in cell wall biosynthesis